MTKEDKRLLLKQATKLTTLGLTVERERSKLEKLIEKGISCDDPRVMEALQRFGKVSTEWSRLEAEHLALRRKLGLSPTRHDNIE